jgi:GNAT superfamily N-acetyltransferase
MQAGDEWIERGVDNLADVWAHCAGAAGGRSVRTPDIRLADAESACPFLNSAVLTRAPGAEDITRLTEGLDAFYERGQRGSWLLWCGWPVPDLSPLGFEDWGRPPLMLRLPGGEPPAAPAELRIVEVNDAATLAVFETTFIDGYPLHWMQPAQPGSLFNARALGGPLRLWIGFVGEQPVSVAAAYESVEVVGVHMVATMPDARGRGYGAAVTWQATLSNPRLPAMLQASDQGRPVYERMGYTTVASMSLWQRERGRTSRPAR